MKQYNLPKVKKKKKDLKELSYVSDLNCLFTALLLVRRDTHTLSLWVCISALLLSQLNKPFLYVLPYLFCYVSNNKLCTCIDSFCLHDKSIFHWGQRSREN